MEWSFTMMPYGDRWRVHRKLCHEALNVGPTEKFDTHQYKYAHRFLSRLLEAPENFLQEVELSVAACPSSPKPSTYAPPNPEALPGP